MHNSHDGAEIDRELFRNIILPKLSTKQYKAAWKAANKDERGIIWWQIGRGKTRIALAWMFMISKDPRPLIICSPKADRQWRDEIRLMGLRKLIHPTFLSSGLISKWRKRKDFVTIDFDAINCIVVDELWMFKNVNSKRSGVVTQLTWRLPSIGLSGSMMTAGNLEDLYGQAAAMNLEKKLSKNLSEFRELYMIATPNFAGFIQRYPRKGSVEAIQRKLIDNVDIYFPKETREIRDIPISVDATTEQLAIKRQLLKSYTYEEENFALEIKSAASLLVKLLCVSDGFIKDNKGNYAIVKSNKMDRLCELCSELLDAGERVLIWVAFKKTAELLSKVLPCKTTLLTGDGKFDVYGWRDHKIKATIATVGSGMSLNDFANVRYAIFYSSSFNSLNVQQARGRTNRKSSLHSCAYYYFLSTAKFPDKSVYEGIENNKSLEEIVIATCKRVLEQHKREGLAMKS